MCIALSTLNKYQMIISYWFTYKIPHFFPFRIFNAQVAVLTFYKLEKKQYNQKCVIHPTVSVWKVNMILND